MEFKRKKYSGAKGFINKKYLYKGIQYPQAKHYEKNWDRQYKKTDIEL